MRSEESSSRGTASCLASFPLNFLNRAPRQTKTCELSGAQPVPPQPRRCCVCILCERRHPIFTPRRQQAISLKDQVEQRCAGAAKSRVIPAANEASAHLGLCGRLSTTGLLLRATTGPSGLVRCCLYHSSVRDGTALAGFGPFSNIPILPQLGC